MTIVIFPSAHIMEDTWAATVPITQHVIRTTTPPIMAVDMDTDMAEVTLSILNGHS